jgi:hypothetical protein
VQVGTEPQGRDEVNRVRRAQRSRQRSGGIEQVRSQGYLHEIAQDHLRAQVRQVTAVPDGTGQLHPAQHRAALGLGDVIDQPFPQGGRLGLLHHELR